VSVYWLLNGFLSSTPSPRTEAGRNSRATPRRAQHLYVVTCIIGGERFRNGIVRCLQSIYLFRRTTQSSPRDLRAALKGLHSALLIDMDVPLGTRPEHRQLGELQCQYPGACENERAIKRNGERHWLCEIHRDRQNRSQRDRHRRVVEEKKRNGGATGCAMGPRAMALPHEKITQEQRVGNRESEHQGTGWCRIFAAEPCPSSRSTTFERETAEDSQVNQGESSGRVPHGFPGCESLKLAAPGRYTSPRRAV
jgi:hypothetical protein